MLAAVFINILLIWTDDFGVLCTLQLDAPVVTQAFLKHDLATLELHCGPELLDRFRGIFQHFTQQVGNGIGLMVYSPQQESASCDQRSFKQGT
jgi:hypothetical protein